MDRYYYVYVLQSLKNNHLYVGFTEKTLKKRLEEHNSGLSFYTKRYLPWKLIHFEGYLSKKDAVRREKYLKTNQGARLLKLMLREYLKVSTTQLVG